MRGKSGAVSGTGESFQWTPAVKALVLLFLRTKFSSNETELTADCIKGSSIEGEPGTPASSLDNALGKEPVWLIELFGRDAAGAPLCRRLFRRANPDRRFAGPVAVGLNAAHWSGHEIAIENCGRPVAASSELENLIERIERGWRTYDRTRKTGAGRIRAESAPPNSQLPPAADNGGYSQFQSILHQCYMNELTESLNRTDIFSRPSLRQLVSSVVENESFVRVAGKRHSDINSLDVEHSAAGRLGMEPALEKRLRSHTQKREITVACGVALFGGLALFEHLRLRKGMQFNIDFRFPHAVEIARHLLNGRFSEQPDILVLGFPPTATLLAHPLGKDYTPLMVLPSVSQKIVAPEGGGEFNRQSERFRDLSYGRYLLMGDDPSHPLFLFEALERRGFVRPSSVEIKSLEPDETVAELSSGNPDARAILFFPFYDINRIFNGCSYLPNPMPSAGPVIAMVHRRIAGDRELVRALDIAVRDSWLKLRESESEREFLVRRFMQDEEFVRAVSRFSGVHNLGGAGGNIFRRADSRKLSPLKS